MQRGRRTDLEQRLRPQPRFIQQFMINEFAGAVVGNGEKRTDEIAVVPNDAGMKIENAHTNCTS